MKLAIFALALAPLVQAPAPVKTSLPVEVPDIVNYHLATPDLAIAGLPEESALRAMRDMGLKTVIDLRNPQEGTAEERTLVEGMGMKYVSVPVSAATLKTSDVDAVVAALQADGGKPALLHCAVSNRAGAMWALLKAREGKSPAEAEEEGRKMGLRPGPMTDALRRLLEGR